MLPRSLEKLLNDTSYPPTTPVTLVSKTNKLVMLVDSVSPTPFALLRRAGHFQYRDSDAALQEFSEYEDPVQALTEECLRVLRAISAANQSQVSSSKHSTSLRDASWSRFEDIGFAGAVEEDEVLEDTHSHRQQSHGLRTTPASGIDLGRPTTPSWADFLSSGFVDDNQPQPNVLLPPDKVLPPIETQVRLQSSQSHRPRLESEEVLQPGELASITVFDLDDAFWWVWMISLAPEETADRKAAFGRCAIVETRIHNGRWLVMEEKIAGAADVPDDGAYIAEKKGLFSWTKRGRSMGRRKSIAKYGADRNDKNMSYGHGSSKTSVGPDTHARIAAKAAQMRAVQEHETQANVLATPRRGRADNDLMSEKTNSVMTLQPHLVGEASSAMKWVKKYDKGTIKDAYMANDNAGRGAAVSSSAMPTTEQADAAVINGSGTAANGAVNGNATGSAHINSNGTTQHNEKRPNVPAKDIASVPSDMKTAEKQEAISAPATKQVKEKVASNMVEAAPALDVQDTPLHQESTEKDDVPPLPPKDLNTLVDAANVPLPAEVVSESADSQNHNFQSSREKSGLRKLFSRKNRSSKVPDNASANLAAMLPKEPAVAEESGQRTPASESTPTLKRQSLATESARESIVEQEPAQKTEHKPEPKMQRDAGPERTLEPTVSEPALEENAVQQKQRRQPLQQPSLKINPQGPIAEPTYDPPADDGPNLSPVDARDAAEAKHEFSKFDQGPLMDQPAMVPMDDFDENDEDDATPPPIARHPPTQQEATSRPKADEPVEKLSQSASPGVQDRWAQIRKNAATRAATRKDEPTSRTTHTKGSGDDDDTSAEESMLSHDSFSTDYQYRLANDNWQLLSPVSHESRPVSLSSPVTWTLEVAHSKAARDSLWLASRRAHFRSDELRKRRIVSDLP